MAPWVGFSESNVALKTDHALSILGATLLADGPIRRKPLLAGRRLFSNRRQLRPRPVAQRDGGGA